MAGSGAEAVPGPGGNSVEAGPEATVVLHVRVADAQGLRLFRGGEIRLVITLRSIEDPEGAAFGLKVTPWQEVPQNCAPTWKPREAIFSVPAERCFSAEFVDSAHLNIALMQKGHAPPFGVNGAVLEPTPELPRRFGLLNLKPEGIAAAFQGAVAAVQGAAVSAVTAPDRGECVGLLRMSVGQRLICPEKAGGMEGITWVQLSDPGDSGQKTKGSLLLELKTAHNHLTVPRSPATNSVVSKDSKEPTAGYSSGNNASQPQSPVSAGASVLTSSEVSCTPEPGPNQTSVPSPEPSIEGEDLSDSASESGVESDFAASQASTSTSATRNDAELAASRPLVERPSIILPTADNSDGSSRSSARGAPAVKWLTSGKPAPAPTDFDSPSGVNIFTINNPNASNSGVDGIGANVYNHLLRWTQKATRRKPIEDRIRSALDPGIRKQRREVRKWRRWHEVFRVLNEIEQRLGEIVSLLVQAAASMSQFGECHNRLSDCAKLSAFLRDAALYFQSESDIPKRLESHLECLERVADEFRTISVEAAELEASREQQSELWKECEDLQVDIAVLLESTQMTAQHALAEYKKMHCRLELLVTEYEPICRLELEVARPAFLPLLTDDSAKQVSAASVPERAVQWALDFATLVGSSSHGLGELVRDLNHRARQVNACSQELRDYTLRFAASAQPDIS